MPLPPNLSLEILVSSPPSPPSIPDLSVQLTCWALPWILPLTPQDHQLPDFTIPQVPSLPPQLPFLAPLPHSPCNPPSTSACPATRPPLPDTCQERVLEEFLASSSSSQVTASRKPSQAPSSSHPGSHLSHPQVLISPPKPSTLHSLPWQHSGLNGSLCSLYLGFTCVHEALPLPKGRIHSGLSGQALAHWRQWGWAGPHVFTHLPCSGTCSVLPLPSLETCLARSPALHPDVTMLALKSGSRCPSFSPGPSTSWEQVSTSFLQRAGQGMLFSFSSPSASVPATGVHHSIAKAATEEHEWMSVAVCHHSYLQKQVPSASKPFTGNPQG